ncbi:MAG TPA: glycine cleavage system aminomethyltransferase GcvT [Candidatus Dormibacteraeota bacterium]|nr:glycine cleavage system aminomethyltransferase GcvT [Candidatus Dormibacteraeota bacterium]
MSEGAKQVPLDRAHRAQGGQMVPFAGYSMPLHYGSIRGEHLAVRERAGLFDVSHMGEVNVTGRGALGFLQELVTNDVSRLGPGRALYTVMCRPDGGVVDDLLVYQLEDGYLCVINAARHDVDLDWMRQHLSGHDAEIEDVSAETVLLAVQGPAAKEIVQSLSPGAELESIRYYHHRPGEVGGVESRISRTGYTGEDGFELYARAADADSLWSELLEAGVPHGLVPAGLGARDTLRLEAGFRLYGQDIDEAHDPLSAGLGWVVKPAKGAFLGREALARAALSPPQGFVGLKLGPREIPRHGHPIFQESRRVGEVTSGSFGFTLGAGLAMGYVDPGSSSPGTELRIQLRADPPQWAVAPVVALPFYKRPGS